MSQVSSESLNKNMNNGRNRSKAGFNKEKIMNKLYLNAYNKCTYHHF